jgi:hypothetical protein
LVCIDTFIAVCSIDYINFVDLAFAYIGDCYFGVITELLVFAPPLLKMSFRAGDPPGCGSGTTVDGAHLLVLGNPGVGKTLLSFLFIRVLLELGAKVCCVLHSYWIFFSPGD